MKKTIATLALLFVVFTSINATEAPSDANCTVEKCKTMTKKDCPQEMKKHCSRDVNKTSNEKASTWSATENKNAPMKMSSCCKNKKPKEAKEESTEEKPMKCAPGKCGGGKCGGK